MSFTDEMPRLERPPAGEPSPGHVCSHCGAPLRDDQEWCLECGAARTLIHRPPDWRIAAAVIAGVVAVVLVGFGIALVNLSSTANRSQPTATTGTTAARAPNSTATAATATAATATPPTARTLATWPVGLSGWTVALDQSRTRADAVAQARRLSASAAMPAVGVLDTSKHPSMTPGYWVVFTGRYPDQAGATAAAQQLQARGASGAVARRVAPPGGL